jgi:DNA gyrase subunit A
MGRVSGGVRGMKIGKDDAIISMSIVPVDQEGIASMIVLTKNGYGKKTPVKDFKIQNRGGTGIKAVKITDKTGNLVGAKIIFNEHEEVIAMSENSQVIRTSLDSVPMLGRDTQGVRIMRLNGDDHVISFVIF